MHKLCDLGGIAFISQMRKPRLEENKNFNVMQTGSKGESNYVHSWTQMTWEVE